MNLSLKWSRILIALCFVSQAFAYDTLEQLNQEFGSKKLEALQNYLKEKPQAPDIQEAKDQCIYILLGLGKQPEALPLLRDKYDFMVKQPEQNLKQIFGEIVPMLVEMYSTAGNKKEAETFLDKVKADFTSHKMFAQINDALERLRASLSQPGVGDTMELKFTAMDGTTAIDLAGMKGKVVLVDFWATWCGPCVKELPNVKACYEKNHAQGFEILGISLDQDKNALTEFLKAQGITWTQQFDGKGWENEFSKKFGISSIPATFLIGKDGKIAAKNLRGAALDEKVTELLKLDLSK